MKAVIRDISKMYLSEIQGDEQLEDDELLVQIDKVGICRTDIYVGEGKISVNKPTILGHECSAYVLKRGKNIHHITIGELVAINPLVPCYQCTNCQKKQTHLCSNAQLMGVELDGCLVKQRKINQQNILKVHQQLDTRLAAYVEPVAAALSIFNAGITKSAQGIILGKNRFTQLLSLILQHKGFENVEVVENVQKLPQSPQTTVRSFLIRFLLSL